MIRAGADTIVPVLVDFLDFCPTSDGERLTPAYAPPVGGRMERDRFAVTRIAEDLFQIAGLGEGTRSYLLKAIEKCRSGPPPNATLLPLQEAIQRATSPQPTAGTPTIDVAVQGAALGPLLSDEGSYWISRSGSLLNIRGATERLEIRQHAESTSVLWARRHRLSQTQIRLEGVTSLLHLGQK